MTTIIAIDPGANGGIAIDTGDNVECFSMPKTEDKILELLRSYFVSAISTKTPVVCFLELIGGYIGGAGAPGSRMFNFGDGWGFLKGVVKAFGVKVILVRPQEWQKFLSIGTAKSTFSGIIPEVKKRGSIKPRSFLEEERLKKSRFKSYVKKEWKNRLETEAQKRFPSLKVTLKNADALLILEYARSRVR